MDSFERRDEPDREGFTYYAGIRSKIPLLD
jgi:hypothetical protein